MEYQQRIFIDWYKGSELRGKSLMILKSKRFWFGGVAVIFSFAAVWFGYQYWREASIDTETLWRDAVQKAAAWDSYHYTLTAEITLDNHRRAETKINGICDVEGNLHIYGEIMDTDLEVYQFGDVYYRQNTNGNSDWIVLENSPLPDNEILLMELYPQQYLLPLDGTANFIEKRKTNGMKEYCYHIDKEENQTVASDYLTDFSYDITIDSKTKEIRKAEITAHSKSNPSGIWKFRVTFTEVNTAIRLEPPQ